MVAVSLVFVKLKAELRYLEESTSFCDTIERIQRSKFHTIIEEFKSGQELKTIMYESTLKVKA